MSYCRFGSDSDVYTYADAIGGITCCVCWDGRSRSVRNPKAMIAHLLEHRLRGDKVPQEAFDRIKRERGWRWLSLQAWRVWSQFRRKR